MAMSDDHCEDVSWIDQEANRFEKAWKSGRRPRIEEYVRDLAGRRRAKLLEELLRVERELRAATNDPATPQEHAKRFPADADVVAAAWSLTPPGARSDRQGADRNLLFAVIALQNYYIDEADLIAAFHAWSRDKARPFDQVLVMRGALTAEEKAEVEGLVARHLKKYGGDIIGTLGAVANAASIAALRSLGDPEVSQTLMSAHSAHGQVLGETLVPPTGENRWRYTFYEIHARGGMGRVWRARDNDLNREVAFKEVLPDQVLEPEVRRRFLQEAQITGQLDHPGIVPVYELARRPGDEQPFYTMKFVRGRTLHEAIKDYHQQRADGRTDPLEWTRLLQAFITVCQAIAYAHSRGVIHRDLKPANVYLGRFGEVIVLDWGLAKMVDRPDPEEPFPSVALSDEAKGEATAQGGLLGTPPYMAPEQAEARLDLIDGRTDIYGLGAILFELLTGRVPHPGKSSNEVIYRIATGETPRARSVDPKVPKALDAICAKAMARERTERYAKATELAEDVQRWLSDEPVSVYPEPVYQRLARQVRRHTAWFLAGAAMIGFAALVLLYANHQISGAKRVAEKDFAVAFGTVREFTTAVSKDIELKRNLPGLQKFRLVRLNQALAYYRNFLRDHGADSRLRAEVAEAYFQIGNVTREIGSEHDALNSYEKAREIREALHQAQPQAEEYQNALGLACFQLADVQRMTGRYGAAERSLNRAQELQEGLVARQPENIEHHNALARTLLRVSALLGRTGRRPKAEELTKRAITILERVDARQPGNLENQIALVEAKANLVALEFVAVPWARSVSGFSGIRDLWEQLVARDPRRTDTRTFLANTLFTLGVLQIEIGDYDQARKNLDRGRDLASRLSNENPDVTLLAASLPLFLQAAGAVEVSAGPLGGLANEVGQAMEGIKKLVNEHPDNVDYLNLLLGLHRSTAVLKLNEGDFNEAERHSAEHRRLAQLLVAGAPEDHRFQSELAGALGAYLFLRKNVQEAENDVSRALAISETLMRQDPQDNLLKSGRVNDLEQLGLLYSKQRKDERALDSYEQAIRLAQELKQRDTSKLGFGGNLGAAFAGRGALWLAMSRNPEAEQDLKQAIAVFVELGVRAPRNIRYRSLLATSYSTLATVQRSAGRTADAEESLRGACDALERLIRDYHNRWFDHWNLSASLTTLGLLQSDQGKPAAAEKSFLRACALMEPLVTSYPDSMTYRNQLAQTRTHLAVLRTRAGRFAESEDDIARARKSAEEMVQREPSAEAPRKTLADTLFALGQLRTLMGRPAEAMQAYAEAVDHQRRLVSEHPASPHYKRQATNTLVALGLVQSNAGRSDLAQQSFAKAVKLLETLTSQEPENKFLTSLAAPSGGETGDLFQLAVIHRRLADLQFGAGQKRESQQNSARALELFQILCKRKPDSFEFQSGLANAHFDLGFLDANASPAELPSAERHFDEARVLRERFVGDHPEELVNQANLGQTLTWLGKTVYEEGRTQDAEKLLSKAIDHLQKAFMLAPNVETNRVQLHFGHLITARVYRAQRRPDKAAAATLERRRLYPADRDVLFGVACSLSLCVPLVGSNNKVLTREEEAERRRYGDQAIETLREAIRLGYQDVQTIEKAPELDPIRSRKEFQDLLLNPGAPKQPDAGPSASIVKPEPRVVPASRALGKKPPQAPPARAAARTDRRCIMVPH
jgi:serine/threonine-protein kinase